MNRDNKEFSSRYVHTPDVKSFKEIDSKTFLYALYLKIHQEDIYNNLTRPSFKHRFKERQKSSADGITKQEKAQANLVGVPVETSLMSYLPPDRRDNLSNGVFGDQDKETVGVIPGPEDIKDEELEYNGVWLANIGNDDDREAFH